jgi:hypothetical protein
MDIDKIIDADKLPRNGVIVVKTKEITTDLVNSLTEMGEKLKPAVAGKNISVFVLKEKDSIETKTPQDMERYGWYKRNKGEMHICIEKGTFLTSLVKDIKGGSKAAIQDLAEMLAAHIEDAIKHPDFDITLKNV